MMFQTILQFQHIVQEQHLQTILEEVPGEVIHIAFPLTSHCGWCLALQKMGLCFWNNVTPGAFCMILILPFQKNL
jgi:hypothetical protein